MVIGGGPAGLKAATVAAKRGHDVNLYEVSSQLGGQINLAQKLPGRAEIGGVTVNLSHQLKLTNAKTSLNQKVDLDFIH